MSRTETPEATVTIAGEPHAVRLDMATLADLKTHVNVNLLDGTQETMQAFMDAVTDPATLPTVLWCFLGGEDAPLTARQIARNLALPDIETITTTLIQALNDASPEPEPKPKGGRSGKSSRSGR